MYDQPSAHPALCLAMLALLGGGVIALSAVVGDHYLHVQPSAQTAGPHRRPPRHL
jgi:hypothetical protein